MITAQVLLLFFSFATIAFVSYWLGVDREMRRTRRYARAAYGNARIAEILAQANRELKEELRSLESNRALTKAEARAFERVIREAGL